MASWMIHLRIADELLDLVPETSATEFVVGNIAPDSGIPSEDGMSFMPSREISHFNTKDQYGITQIHEERFIEKYYTKEQRAGYDEKQRAFYLGYVVHLLTDKLWIKNVTHPTREKFSDLFERNQGEFWRRMKADWYGLDTVYIKNNPDFRAFRLYEEAVGFQNRYLDFYSRDAFDLRRRDIVSFYKRDCDLTDKKFTFYSEEEMSEFVKQASLNIRQGLMEMELRENIDCGFRGNILVVQNGKILLEQINGFADLPNEVPNTLDTKFASASAGKVFVAVGILQLIEKGKLHFEDTLGEILNIDLHDIDPDVTVKQLLTHTSGVPDYFNESVMDEYEELWTDYPNYKIRRNEDLLPLFINKPMMYPKGDKFQYNNTGYVLLAMIMEKVSGMPFDEYLQEHVFDICGMRGTGYYELDKLPAKCANNYIYCEKSNDYRTNIFSVDVKGTGAGGAFITVTDVINFWKGLTGHKLLSKEMTQEMLRKQSGNEEGKSGDEESNYGYGVWIIENDNGNDIPYFQGCDPGVSFISEFNPDNNTISVLVSNYGDNVWKEMRKIRGCLYDLKV